MRQYVLGQPAATKSNEERTQGETVNQIEAESARTDGLVAGFRESDEVVMFGENLDAVCDLHYIRPGHAADRDMSEDRTRSTKVEGALTV